MKEERLLSNGFFFCENINDDVLRRRGGGGDRGSIEGVVDEWCDGGEY